MGGWLTRLKNQKVPDTYATKPTEPSSGDEKEGFVGFVADPRAPFQKIIAADSVVETPQTPPAKAAKPFEPTIRQAFASLKPRDERRVRAWLTMIDARDSSPGYGDPAAIRDLLEKARLDADVREYFLQRAEAEL